ncbi:MAG: hypothetical protein ACRDK4_05130 [Solirubrobacteraceae bacterium]
MSATETVDLSTIPGAMEHTLVRELSEGIVEFEQAPKGWLKKDGEPRLKDHRAYHWTPNEEKRKRLVSVTTMLDDVFPKGGLPVWAEREGIKGAVEAVRMGLIGPDVDLDQAVEIVRANKLGAENAKRQAADRGLNIHALLEAYMLTSAAPVLKDHPEAHRGYIQALTRWLLEADPEPKAVEELVVHPEEGYAGRLDLRAVIDGALVTVDAKTQENGGIFESAHYQVNMYERAAVRCGAPPAERCMVVVFAANGEFREAEANHDDWRIDAALAHYRAKKPISSMCESTNAAERRARQAVAA